MHDARKEKETGVVNGLAWTLWEEVFSRLKR